MTDEEIVKGVEWCASVNKSLGYIDGYACKFIGLADILNLINRQKAEIERLTSLYDGKSGFMTSSIGDLPLTVEGLRTAVDEIARLDRAQAELQEYNEKNYNEAKDLRRKNAELQKQVDELKAKLQCPTDITEAVKPFVNEAVKDTAKEILGEIDLFFKGTTFRKGYEFKKIEAKIKEIAERFGVEVE